MDQQTESDIQQDFLFLISVIHEYKKNLYQYKKIIQKHKNILPAFSLQQTQEYVHTLEESFFNLERNIQTGTKDFHTYLEYYEQLRSMLSMYSGILTSLDYQSPSFFSSIHSQAGQRTGIIKQAWNDYARDQHQGGNMYERHFLREYIDAPIKLPFHVYATNSGMAALTTIVGFIKGENISNKPILIGSSCYFEEKIVLRVLFKEREIIEIDEENIEECVQIIKEKQPQAVFMDSISNTSNKIQPNIHLLLTTLKKNVKHQCYIVIDNTGLSCTFQPFASDFSSHSYIQIIVWESLIKHHQLGMDRINGGIIYTNIPKGISIYTYRDHLGTNISDIAAYMLPSPNRKRLESRLARHERNVQLLINQVTTVINNKTTKISGISQTKDTHTLFHGAFVSLSFHQQYDNLANYRMFMNRIFEKSKKAHIPIIGGTSFGFPITRVYIPASRPGQGKPFIRIAVGTEPFDDFLHVSTIISGSL